MALGEKTGGRQPGTPNKATAEVRALARNYAPAAMAELARLSTEAQSEQARVSACNSLLDRAYGKSPIGAPVAIELPDTSTTKGVSEAFGAIVSAVSSGDLLPAEAASVAGIVESQRKAIELMEIEERLKRLEAAEERRAR